MNRAGQYVSVLKGELAYKAYKPNPLPPSPEIVMDNDFVSLLAKAQNYLGQLDAVSKLVPNIDLFLGAYVRKEALLSSQIEGTQATLEDVLNADNESSVNLDVSDVINYVNALNFAVDRMRTLPICGRLLCEVHNVLMQNVRGQEKNPGEFRRSQNWIGGANSTIQTARYVPPTVEDMQQALSDLEKFINESDLDVLIKTALVHYQFETIHPFLDGNGRIGRMLIILMLLNEHALSRPVLYLSLFLKTNRIEYYDRLSEVRAKGNYEQWIKFFLTGIIETCQNCIQTITAMDSLITSDRQKLSDQTKITIAVFDYLKEHPIINIGVTAKALGVSFNTVSSAIKQMMTLGIVAENGAKARERIFEYTAYLNILKAGVDK